MRSQIGHEYANADSKECGFLGRKMEWRERVDRESIVRLQSGKRVRGNPLSRSVKGDSPKDFHAARASLTLSYRDTVLWSSHVQIRQKRRRPRHIKTTESTARMRPLNGARGPQPTGQHERFLDQQSERDEKMERKNEGARKRKK